MTYGLGCLDFVWKSENYVRLGPECADEWHAVTDGGRHRPCRVALSDLTGTETPIGSVERTMRWCDEYGISRPPPVDAVRPGLLELYGRDYEVCAYGDARDDDFVKPVETKKFLAALKRNVREDVEPSTLVYKQSVVTFLAEFRFYCRAGGIVGISRYDPGDVDHDHTATVAIAERAALVMSDYAGFAVDVGLGADGLPRLVEINDAWALGIYRWDPDPITHTEYRKLVAERWSQILRR